MTLPISNLWTKLAVGLALVVVGWLWLREHDARVRYQALAQVSRDSVLVVKARLDSVLTTRAHQDSALAWARSRVDSANREANRIATEALKRTVTAVDKLKVTLDSTQKQQLDSVVAGYDTQITALRSQLSEGAKLLALTQERLDSAKSDVQQLREFNNELVKKLDKLTDASRPSLSQRVGRLLPWAVVAGLIVTR